MTKTKTMSHEQDLGAYIQVHSNVLSLTGYLVCFGRSREAKRAPGSSEITPK